MPRELISVSCPISLLVRRSHALDVEFALAMHVLTWIGCGGNGTATGGYGRALPLRQRGATGEQSIDEKTPDLCYNKMRLYMHGT